MEPGDSLDGRGLGVPVVLSVLVGEPGFVSTEGVVTEMGVTSVGAFSSTGLAISFFPAALVCISSRSIFLYVIHRLSFFVLLQLVVAKRVHNAIVLSCYYR